MFRNTKLALVAAAGLLLLTACGQKGPLYLPSQDIQQTTDQRESQ
ncbi:MAG: lipoprotein [Candidatus Thiodiazotropha sp. (ex Epidulcina cf. delphinae)]|nr:lipoprotein [Candidatus Thiodiazotropha sp. (ex Epidulcina cf. delphinae)]